MKPFSSPRRALSRQGSGSLVAGRLAAGALLAALWIAGCARTQRPLATPLDSSAYYDGCELHTLEPVAPGVVHRFDSFSTGPMTINTVIIDTRRRDLFLETEKAQDNLTSGETVHAMVSRLYSPVARPVVAINADFWGVRHIPIGLLVDEGTIWKGPYVNRSVFAFDDKGHFALGPPEWSVRLTGPETGQALPIDQINFDFTPNAKRDAVAYTWPHGATSPEPEPGQTLVILSLAGEEWLPNAPARATVRSVVRTGSVALDRRTVAVLLQSDPPGWLKPGTPVTLDARLRNLPGKVIGAVGGVPQLLKDGKIVARESAERETIGANFVTDRHPRTAIGIKRDGKTLVLAVVDGRQPTRSIGIDLLDLAAWMKKQGCVDAMNLDGGGSSSMVIRDRIVNFPSDASGPRPVSDALVLVRTAPVGPLDHLAIRPRNALVPSNARVRLAASGFDVEEEPVSLEGWTVSWAARGGDATIDSQGVLDTGAGEGDIAIRVVAQPSEREEARNPKSSSPFGETRFVVQEPATLEVVPSAVLMDTGDEVKLRFQARAADGRVFLNDPVLWEVTVPPFLRFVPSEGRVKAVQPGAGFIKARLGSGAARIPVAVDRFKESLAYSFDTLPAADPGPWIEGSRYKPEGTSIVLEPENKKEGTGAWRFTYAMAGGGTTRIALPLGAPLPGRPLAVGVWVYGDGQSQWLRGELRDAENRPYSLDFTNATTGINWKDQWRFVQSSLVNPTPIGGHRGKLTPPLTVKTLYVAQGQEAAKRDGQILLDGLYALSLPDELTAPAPRTE